MTRQGEWLALARRLCAVALLAVCVWPSVTRAQASDSSEYEQLVDKGIAEYRAGHWEESRSLFEQAHAINPNARTLRGLGLAATRAATTSHASSTSSRRSPTRASR